MNKKIFLIGLGEEIKNFLVVCYSENEIFVLDTAEDLDYASEDKEIAPFLIVVGEGIKEVGLHIIASMFDCKKVYVGSSTSSTVFDLCVQWPKDSDRLRDQTDEWLTQNDDTNYIQVYFPEIDINDVYDFDLYTHLKLNNKYILFKSKGLPWSAKKMSGFNAQSVLYILKSDEQKYLDFVSGGIHQLFANDKDSKKFSKTIKNLFHQLLLENKSDGKVTELSYRIISNYLTHDSASVWGKAVSKYSDDKNKYLMAQRFSTICSLMAMVMNYKKIDSLFYATYFMALVDSTLSIKGEKSLIESVKQLIHQENIILTDDVFELMQSWNNYKISEIFTEGDDVQILIDLSCKLNDLLMSGNFSTENLNNVFKSYSANNKCLNDLEDLFKMAQ